MIQDSDKCVTSNFPLEQSLSGWLATLYMKAMGEDPERPGSHISTEIRAM